MIRASFASLAACSLSFVVLACATTEGPIGNSGGTVGAGAGTGTGAAPGSGGSPEGSGASSSGGLGGAASGTGGSGTGGSATGGSTTGGTGGSSDFDGQCQGESSYAEWKALPDGDKGQTNAVFTCEKSQGACSGQTLGEDYLFECVNQIGNCAAQSPSDANSWALLGPCVAGMGGASGG